MYHIGGGEFIAISDVSLKLYKWNGTSIGNDIYSTHLTSTPPTITNTGATYFFSNLTPGRYIYLMSVPNTNGDTSFSYANFYIDQPEIIVNKSTIYTSTGGVELNEELEFIVKTIGAPYRLELKKLTNFQNLEGSLTKEWNKIGDWDGTKGLWYEIASGGSYSGTKYTISSNPEFVNEPLNTNLDGNIEEKTHKIKIKTKLLTLQGAGEYNMEIGINSFFTYNKQDGEINGECGSLAGNYSATEPTETQQENSLCGGGESKGLSGILETEILEGTEIDTTNMWVWGCMGDNGGANAICSAQKVRNCEANTNLNGYNMPYTNHKATTSTLTKTLPISNGKQIYQTTFKCNDGTFEQNTETITNVECNTNYTANQETKTCVADTKTFICEAKPDNTIWNMGSNNGSYTQIRNGAGRSPPNTNTTYNTISSSNECNYICETNYTWDSLNNSCDDCTAYTLNSCPTHANCSSCANGKYKIESCKDNYTGANCEVEPEITAKNSCTSRGQILSAGSRFTNKDGIAYNAGVQCDTNDIIVCTGSGAGLTLAACNVGARYATGITSSYTTDNVGLHFQRGSSTGYLSENTYTLSTSYNYPVDSGLVKGSGSKSDKWNQGPCPASYHIPDWNEWIRLLEAGNGGGWTLGAKKNDPIFNYRSWSSWGNDFRTALKLPAAGRRKSSSFNNIGSAGRYWSTSTMSEGVMRMLHFGSSSVIPDDYRPRRHGYSIRCFKD